eukprot:CAMPEP_0172675046 /NCGR_PEP_ID=MMETSP1074-20121228/13060_1 /TAXON_ID=2916 /ORGANISM="Ceratium fusus, Strain PA161109" /LENGTH=407 /DNA_ID=CAMNT_0013492493 /DNA_START=49 /DNA_END=1272 /DNA_ORIENTATION=+
MKVLPNAEKAVDELDAMQGKGLAGTGDDWTAVPHSMRKDRPLPRSLVVELSKKSDWEGLKRATVHCGLIVLFGNLLWMTRGALSRTEGIFGSVAVGVLLFGLIVLQGFLISALGFAMQHECLHLTAFRTRILNYIFGILGCVPALSFFEHELLMHKDHHTYTGDLKRDSELLSVPLGGVADTLRPVVAENIHSAAVANRVAGFKKVPNSRFEYIEAYVRLDRYLLTKLKRLIRCAFGQAVDYSGKRWALPTPAGDADVPGTPANKLQRAARLHLLLALGTISLWATIGDMRAMLWCWMLPMLVGPAPLYFVQLHEHADCALDPSNGLTNTRTTLTSGFVSYVMWEMGYHAEHHLYPFFPFYQLPKAHKYLKEHLKKVSNSHVEANLQAWHSWIPLQAAAMQKAAKAA